MEYYTKLALVAMVLVAALVTEPMATNGFKICGVTTDALKTCQPAVAEGVNPRPAPTTDCCSAINKADLPCFFDKIALEIISVDECALLAIEGIISLINVSFEVTSSVYGKLVSSGNAYIVSIDDLFDFVTDS
ncbi:hypothetical protein CTI12_AA336360 [Artemisia annua]|uniref:Bifunctional inhibitor/plant lipid transfer protein/seed storage helical domain-containing protein n=1 Tax=Artemisia annua TaxID=35608 RepID=A0A2U1LNN2_ARTAN|nr:hypothetical protein CTI12_AA336360 [Artemisia annua]